MSEIYEILQHSQPGYAPVTHFGQWKVAMTNHSDVSARDNLQSVAKHLESDEVFALLQGEAAVYVADGSRLPTSLERIVLRPGTALSVHKGMWHALETTPGTRILIIENENTGSENTVSYNVPRRLFQTV